VSDSFPRLCTGFDTKTEPTPVSPPGPGFFAIAAPTTTTLAAMAMPNATMTLRMIILPLV
jgi:hypothetical protein